MPSKNFVIAVECKKKRKPSHFTNKLQYMTKVVVLLKKMRYGTCDSSIEDGVAKKAPSSSGGDGRPSSSSSSSTTDVFTDSVAISAV